MSSGKKQTQVTKQFVQTYRTFDIYQITDACGNVFYVAEKDNPEHGATQTGYSLTDVHMQVDKFIIHIKNKRIKDLWVH